MSEDQQQLKDLFNMFGDELKTLVTTIHEDTNMEDEHFATVVSNGIVGAMDSSVKALQVIKTNALVDQQIESEKNRTTFINEDIELKKEQKYTVIAKRKREQGATVNEDGTITYSNDGTSQIEKQIALLEKQAEKVVKDIWFTDKQGINMDKQVIHNCIIQAMDKAEGYNMGIGNAGLIPSQAMHTNFFIQNKALLIEAGIEFTENGEAKLGDIVLGTFNIAANATQSSS